MVAKPARLAFRISLPFVSATYQRLPALFLCRHSHPHALRSWKLLRQTSDQERMAASTPGILLTMF